MSIGAPAEVVLEEQLVKPLATDGRSVNVMHISQLATGG